MGECVENEVKQNEIRRSRIIRRLGGLGVEHIGNVEPACVHK